MPIRNNLRVLMAKEGFRSITELSEQRTMKDFKYARILRFVKNQHSKLDGELIEALCKELKCDIQDLLYIEKEKVR
ncbi:helix-turn-helix transcriptional regulator [Cytobacillus horneckiae]|uniref:helix-turn-helix domain-containing protein n=1 Tax=Cytobacillus horneckiae TaxID=549687 RepID=UPI0039A176E1